MATKKQTIRMRARQVLARTKELEASGANWTKGHNLIFGPGGPAAQLFSSVEERTAFSQTPEFTQIHEILEGLSKSKGKAKPSRQPADVSGKFLVRIPKSIHASLLVEAEAEGVSLNQLVVSKLSTQLRALVSTES